MRTPLGAKIYKGAWSWDITKTRHLRRLIHHRPILHNLSLFIDWARLWREEYWFRKFRSDLDMSILSLHPRNVFRQAYTLHAKTSHAITLENKKLLNRFNEGVMVLGEDNDDEEEALPAEPGKKEKSIRFVKFCTDQAIDLFEQPRLPQSAASL